MAFGAAVLKKLLLTFAPSPAFNLAIENMSLQKRELMSHISRKWSTVLSHLYCIVFYRKLVGFLSEKWKKPYQVVDFLFACCDQLYSVLEEPGPHKASKSSQL